MGALEEKIEVPPHPRKKDMQELHVLRQKKMNRNNVIEDKKQSYLLELQRYRGAKVRYNVAIFQHELCR